MITRVLFLGNNTPETNDRARVHPASRHLAFHGLIIDAADATAAGVYHTTVFDLPPAQIQDLAQTMDRVIMLDQSQHSYNHPDAWLQTVQVILDINDAEFENPATADQVRYWQSLIKHNQSFCLLPWIEYMTRGEATALCCRSPEPVSRNFEITDFSAHAEYIPIRQAMLRGQMLPNHCQHCYDQEQQGLISARQQETVQWAVRLKLDNVQQLDKFKQPVYYEMRSSNHCNLQCRTCHPRHSHLIAREYKKLKLIDQTVDYRSNHSDKINLQTVEKLYVAGGEPMVMPEFIRFLETARDSGRTDFDLEINTNGTVMPQRVRSLLDNFSRVHFIFSIDGIGEINEYIRSNSVWSDILANFEWAYRSRHHASINTTVSVYNITHLHEIMEWLDRDFPRTLMHLQTASSAMGLMDPDLHPNLSAVIMGLERCQQTACYRHNKQVKNWIDVFLRHLRNDHEHDTERWHRFRDFNRLLDQSRGTDLDHVLLDVSDPVTAAQTR